MNVRGKKMRGKLLAAWAGAALCAIFSLPAPGQAPQGDAPAPGMGMGRGMGMAPGMGMGMGGDATAGTRKVYLDGWRRSEDENINGSSIGSLSGAAVHIESDGFGPEGANALMANRVQGSGSVYWLSDEFRLYERYTPIDENTLDFVLQIFLGADCDPEVARRFLTEG